MIAYFDALTPPAAAILLLHILRCVIWRNGICVLPDVLLFGDWGSAPFPWLIFVSVDYKDHAALIAHERCHQDQQRRDGWLRWVWRYITDKQARLDYEVDAYRVWVQVAPGDLWRCVYWLRTGYGLQLSDAEAIALLKNQ
jgi:hypothetical protein